MVLQCSLTELYQTVLSTQKSEQFEKKKAVKVFENRVLSSLFYLETQDVTGGFNMLHYEDYVFLT
jgi:hypothetical protein